MTEVNQELENKLWSVSDDRRLTDASVEAIKYLVKRFENFLQIKLILNTHIDEIDEQGFCWTFKSDNSINFLQPFAISLNGVIGMSFNYDENLPHYSASVFLFGDRHRLISKHDSYIEFFYEKQIDETGKWVSLGWQEDEFGEFEDVDVETYG
jgi:hypothetical protein